MKKICLLLLVVILSSCAENTQNTEKPKAKERIVQEAVLAEASTTLFDRSENRVSNIKLACNSINGKILNPKEEFSFNNMTGDRSRENGYKEAPVISDGEPSVGTGGGVCQLSTVIYMAVLDAKLNVTEHHLHSKPLEYAPERNDATVVFGKLDLRFINNTERKIRIDVWVTNENVCCRLVSL